MTAKEAMAFVEKHGVVLVSAKGPVPRLTEAIAGEPVKGSWWGHPQSQKIYAILQALAESEDILFCRLVEGKITLVHRRLWPALVRVAKRFPPDQVAQVRQEHTPSGHHVNREVAFSKWVPTAVKAEARKMDDQEALIALGSWTQADQTELKRKNRKR
jgi:hypothetical protein